MGTVTLELLAGQLGLQGERFKVGHDGHRTEYRGHDTKRRLVWL